MSDTPLQTAIRPHPAFKTVVGEEMGYSITAKLQLCPSMAQNKEFESIYSLFEGEARIPLAPIALGCTALFDNPEQAGPFAERIVNFLGPMMPGKTITVRTEPFSIGSTLAGMIAGDCLTTSTLAVGLRKIIGWALPKLAKHVWQEKDPQTRDLSESGSPPAGGKCWRR